MNFHEIGNEGFLFSNHTDIEFWEDNSHQVTLDIKTIKERYQNLYIKASLDALKKLQESGFDVQIHSYRKRKYKVFEPFSGYTFLELDGMRIARKAGGKKSTAFLRTFLRMR